MDNTFIAKIIFFFLISLFLWWLVTIYIKNLTSKLPPLKRVLIATYTICHLYLTLAFIASNIHMNFDHDDRGTYKQIKSLVNKQNLQEPEDLPSFINGLYEPNQIEILCTDNSRDLKVANSYVESCPTLLQKLKPILKSKTFRFPEPTKKGFDIESILGISNFLSYSTNYSAYRKNNQTAFEYANTNLQFAELILKFNNKNSMSWLAAMIPVNQSCESVQNFITASTLSEGELKSLLNNVPSTEKFLIHTRNSLIAERSIVSAAQYDNTPTARLREVKKEYEKVFGRNYDDVYNSNYDPVTLSKQIKLNYKEEIESIGKPFAPYRIKKTKTDKINLADTYLEVPKNLKQRGLECITAVEATKLIISCKRFELKHGSLPQNLKQLVPEFIKEVPRDPFDHKPFRYNAEKKLIYSVGPNLIDSKGMTKHQIRRKENISFDEAKAKADLVFYLERQFKVR